MEKAELREAMRALQRALPAEDRKEADAAICSHILNSSFYRKADSIFAYVGVDWEIDTMPLLERILQDGKRLFLPRVWENAGMKILDTRTLANLSPDCCSIPSPPPFRPAASPAEIDLALVPCVAATREAVRLGQGGGYYDGFLSLYSGPSLLLARECAVLPELPSAPHDRSCTALVTENGIQLH